MKTNSVFKENQKGDLVWMTAEHISAPHAFTTRFGGVSTGYLASMNLGEHRGDTPENVRENYTILLRGLEMPLENLVVSRQVHETDVRRVSKEDVHTLGVDVSYTADGLITDIPELPIMIYTADCIPILLHDPVRGAAGAVHAGWRGTCADIAGIAVMRMAEEFGCLPENIRVAIGPGISRCCFETSNDVAIAVRGVLGEKAAEFLDEKPNGKFMTDLKGVNRALLLRRGVKAEHILISDECTMCCHDKYWSHRYTGGVRGSQASVIMLKGTNDN